MTSRLARLAVLAALVVPLVSCQPVSRYLRHRAGDLSDALQLSVGGPAFGAHVEATALVNAGLDVWQARPGRGGAFGNFTHRLPQGEHFLAYSIILFHARGYDADPMARDPSNDDDFPPVHAGFSTHAHELGRAFEDSPAPENLRPTRWLDVELSAGVFLGVRARASPGELIDFLLGWFGLDIAGDDA